MDINTLNKYQIETGLIFVMGGDSMKQYKALQKFKDLVIKEYIQENDVFKIEFPEGLPKANQRVAIVDMFGRLDICKFIAVSDGTWYWDNGIDCIYQSYEVKEWKAI